MDYTEQLQRLAIALAIGLIIGIERGWTMRAEAEGGAVILAAIFLAFALVIGFLRYREMERDQTFGATTVLAAYVAFALGALAGVGEMGAAAAASVAAAALLAMKSALHGWLEKVTWNELRAGILLLAMTLILLPILPNQGFGPFAAVNPYELWLMTILIAGVSFAGYIGLKWVGGTHGVVLSGLAGGLVSSTATTLSLSRFAREHADRQEPLIAGALLAGSTMMARILVVSASVNPALLRWLAPPLFLAAAALAAQAAFNLRAVGRAALDQPLALKNPFELWTVLKFGAFLALVMVAAKALTAWAGEAGAYTLAAFSGLADVDAVTLTMSRLCGGGALGEQSAATAILVAAAVNTVVKVGLGWFAGGRGPGLGLALGAGLSLAAGALGLAISRVSDPFALISLAPIAT
jgi:uncharacterized membrane protein (DUF4010 family)